MKKKINLEELSRAGFQEFRIKRENNRIGIYKPCEDDKYELVYYGRIGYMTDMVMRGLFEKELSDY